MGVSGCVCGWRVGGGGGDQTDIGDGGLERDISFFFLLDELQSIDFRGRQCRHRVGGIVNHS